MPKEYLELAWRCKRKWERAVHGGLGKGNGAESVNFCLASVGTCDQVRVFRNWRHFVMYKCEVGLNRL